MNKTIHVASLLVLMLLSLPSGQAAQMAEAENAMPALHEGERLYYDIRWGIFPAGEAVLEIWHAESPGSGNVYEIELRASTSGLFRAVYPLQAWLRSVLSPDLKRSLDFHKLQNGRETRIEFDWEAGTAQYSSEGDTREPIDLPDNALDPLALIVAARNQNLATGASLRRYFTDGKRSIEGEARVVDQEVVETPLGEFETAVVKPTLEGVGGVFSRSRNPSLTIWFSQDERRLPVRITSKMALGHLTGELVAVEKLKAEGRSSQE